MANETKACRDIGALLPAAQAACRAFLRECEREGLAVLITETYRTQERQDYLYAQGRTRAGTIITWTRKSRHTGRLAWDVCKNVKGRNTPMQHFSTDAEGLRRSWGLHGAADGTRPTVPILR